MSTIPPPFVPTPEQKQVILHRDSHLQVVACAGAGKTEAISRRVAGLLVDGVEPNQIVAFTFTERAATGLKNRIQQRVAEAKGADFLDKLGPMFVGTIHAYCLRLLQDHVPELGNFDVLDDHRVAGLLSREHKRLELSKLGDKHWRPIADFKQNADVLENELIDPQALADTPFGECYLRFKDTLYRYHFLTYGLLISAAVKALQKSAVFQRVHESLRHLIVDEYQDINPAQEKLIALLAQPPVQLCVVADDDQSIYQWRGSDVSHMLEFAARYTATSVTLSFNRRSRPTIIAKANTFALTIAPRLTKQMQPHRPAGGPEVHPWAAETPEAEAETIANTIGQMRDRGYRYRDVAILFRSVKSGAPPLIDAFEARGIPYRCGGRTGLFLQREASVLGATYAWLVDNDWRNKPYAAPEPVVLDQLLADYAETFNAGQPIPTLKEYLTDWKGHVTDNTASVNLVRDYYQLLHLLGVHNLDLEAPATSATLGCLARFSQILADFEHVTRRARYVEENGERIFRGGTDRGVWFYRRLFNFLQYYAVDKYEDFEGEETFDLDAVDILTVHQAKGLEWPVVFLPGLVGGRFPSKFAGKPQEWLIDESAFPQESRLRYQGGEVEERRLFYVAMTRARDALYLSRFRKITNRFAPSVFLMEVAGADPEIADALPLPEAFTPPGDEAPDAPKVSFSELAHYEDCPLRYRFSTSLGFQPQLAPELGYGKTIHHILRHVAEFTRANKRPPTPDEVEALFVKEFYLPFASRPAFEQLHGTAKALVSKYLASYKDDLLRIWQTERPFELHLKEGVVHGRADVILDKEGGKINHLAIVDYKTATEGRTDDVFGFQLAIYTAAGRGEGLTVDAAYLHHLKEGERRPVPVDKVAVKKARSRAEVLIESIVAGDFPARPEKERCQKCDVRNVCKHAIRGKYDV